MAAASPPPICHGERGDGPPTLQSRHQMRVLVGLGHSASIQWSTHGCTWVRRAGWRKWRPAGIDPHLCAWAKRRRRAPGDRPVLFVKPGKHAFIEPRTVRPLRDEIVRCGRSQAWPGCGRRPLRPRWPPVDTTFLDQKRFPVSLSTRKTRVKRGRSCLGPCWDLGFRRCGHWLETLRAASPLTGGGGCASRAGASEEHVKTAPPHSAKRGG